MKASVAPLELYKVSCCAKISCKCLYEGKMHRYLKQGVLLEHIREATKLYADKYFLPKTLMITPLVRKKVFIEVVGVELIQVRGTEFKAV